MFFKSVDEKLKYLGFIKQEDTKYCVRYHRDTGKYLQTVDLLHKHSGNHLILSYDTDLTDTQNIGNTCVGLNYKEANLFLKKMKQKGWHKT